jgi:hypothetical protein
MDGGPKLEDFINVTHHAGMADPRISVVVTLTES